MAQDAEAVAVAENGAMASPVVFTVKPWLVVESPKANDAVEFYKAAFGAEEVSRINHPKRKAEQELPLILSAELKIGDSSIVVSDLVDDYTSPVKSAVSGSVFCLEADDVEAAVSQAVAAGGVSEGEVAEGENACCGGRVGKVKDPYGNVWLICAPIKKCTPMKRAAPIAI